MQKNTPDYYWFNQHNLLTKNTNRLDNLPLPGKMSLFPKHLFHLRRYLTVNKGRKITLLHVSDLFCQVYSFFQALSGCTNGAI